VKVVIIGAGIGGLTLAAALRRRAPRTDIEVYERDDGPFHRPQGYAIGLKNDGGLGALARFGLRDAVLAGDTSRVTNFVFTDQRGRELLALAAGADEKRVTYRVQRRHLKQVLLDAVGDTTIHYGKACVGYEPGAAEALFAGGGRVAADAVVGCDGVASAVRQQMIGDRTNFLGLSAIYGDAGVQPAHPLLAGGYFMSLGDDGSSFFAYTQPDGTTHLSYTTHGETGGLLDTVRNGTAGWHPLIAELVAATKVESLGVRGYYDREPAARVTTHGVWLIGDAAHPMCPFQGQGANTAMLDALDVADLLVDGGDPAPVAAKIARRGRKAVLDSRRAAAQFHETRRFRQRNRNLGFRMANAFIRLAGRVRRDA
jgi:salicylate hydroxylase